jgi:hypothetical protein
MKANGLDLVPERGAKITIDPKTGLLESGNGTLKLKAGSVVLFDGRIMMDPNCNPKQTECSVFKAAVPAFSQVKGIPLKGEMEVLFTPRGTRVKVNGDIFGETGFGATVRFDLTVDDKKGSSSTTSRSARRSCRCRRTSRSASSSSSTRRPTSAGRAAATS